MAERARVEPRQSRRQKHRWLGRGAVRLLGRQRTRPISGRPPRAGQASARSPRLALTWHWASLLFGRVLALAVLLACLWLLYHGATSPDFRVSRVRIVGTHLATPAEVADAAGVAGRNIFWLSPGEVARRLESLPSVASATVELRLPDRVEIQVHERAPVAVWESAGASFLVDEGGMVLAPEASASLPVVRDLSDRAVQLGERVDAEALKTAVLLSRLLPQLAQFAPAVFDYRPESGLEAPGVFGWRVRFGDSRDLAWKLSALRGIRQHLEEAGQTASFVDLRFKERPYYR